ncbi:hypothetical protein [Nonomuraea sp. NPDC046570]|uniref:hypothetical protein n=1 Tax=Nonomuraea sp. NPDC046570 TaxID=3155255 RepID=UPI0033C15E55
MGRWTVERLRARGVDVRLGTRLESAESSRTVLDDGTSFAAATLDRRSQTHPVVRAGDPPTAR